MSRRQRNYLVNPGDDLRLLQLTKLAPDTAKVVTTYGDQDGDHIIVYDQSFQDTPDWEELPVFDVRASQFKDSGERRSFDTGAVRDVAIGKGRFDLLQFRAIWEVARVLETGCLKYGDRNWEKGIKVSSFIDSGLRHLARFMLGHNDEPHLSMACWNLLCCLDTILRIKEGSLPDSLCDLPFDLEKINVLEKQFNQTAK